MSQREAQVCTTRVCELLIHLLNFLLDMGLLLPSLKKGRAAGDRGADASTAGSGADGAGGGGGGGSKEESDNDGEVKPIELFLPVVLR